MSTTLTKVRVAGRAITKLTYTVPVFNPNGFGPLAVVALNDVISTEVVGTVAAGPRYIYVGTGVAVGDGVAEGVGVGVAVGDGVAEGVGVGVGVG